MRQINPESSISLIQVTEINSVVAMMLNKKISNGEFIVVAGDRTPAVRSELQPSARLTWASFLGHPAPFPQGPFILAGILKCPVLTLFCLKKDGRYHIIFERFAEIIESSRQTRADTLNKCVTRYATRLEHHCFSYPFQWFNFFDFWSQASTMPPRDISDRSYKANGSDNQK
jgi:predicted LPLAT superfamily acyltransferase